MSQIVATYIDHMGSDLSVVNAARVSFGKKSEWEWEEAGVKAFGHESYQRLSDRDANLIRYLASGMSAKDIEKWKTQMVESNDPKLVMEAYHALSAAQPHMSPFGHAFASFHVKAPIFVARQLVKHKFLRWNEISRRYVDDEPEFYVPDVWRGRSADKKQGSSDKELELRFVSDCMFFDEDDGTRYDFLYKLGVDDDPDQSFQDGILEDLSMILLRYNNLLRIGVAPEQARMVLPQNTMTEWYWSGSLDAFASMCNLRLKEDTQYESRIVAQQISDVMKELFPVSWSSLVVEGG